MILCQLPNAGVRGEQQAGHATQNIADGTVNAGAVVKVHLSIKGEHTGQVDEEPGLVLHKYRVVQIGGVQHAAVCRVRVGDPQVHQPQIVNKLRHKVGVGEPFGAAHGELFEIRRIGHRAGKAQLGFRGQRLLLSQG